MEIKCGCGWTGDKAEEVFIDDSFSHWFGTETIKYYYYLCPNCGEELYSMTERERGGPTREDVLGMED